MKQVYMISGLGADELAFQYLELSSFEKIYVQWLKPGKRESIVNYSKRLLDQIKTPEPILVGISFGGLIAMELGKLIPTEKIVLISSAKQFLELPWYYRVPGHIRLHRVIPSRLMKQPGIINDWLFGVTNDHDRQLLRTILKGTDPDFMAWAIDKIVHWRNRLIHDNVVHIHGTADRVIPYKEGCCHISIENGGHFMIVNKAAQISQHLKEILL